MSKRLMMSILILLGSLSWMDGQILINEDTVHVQVVENYEVVGHNTFINAIPQQKTFRWIRNEVIVPEPWQTAICDANQCYLYFVDSMQIELGPNASSLLDVHLYLNQEYTGYALVEMTVKDVSNPASSVSAVYIFDSETSSSLETESMAFRVYPNPGNGLFKIDQNARIERVEVFDLFGKRLLEIDIKGRDFIRIGHLPPAHYLFRMMDADGKILAIKQVQKL